MQKIILSFVCETLTWLSGFISGFCSGGGGAIVSCPNIGGGGKHNIILN